ncbi:uncharacterized protein LOC118425812 [Branchiostoma floridae]|uniref:Uncharacterized protein LOC118425812 n=1 Tax=Branchiostoma floridae TaxID=7739 RepID=A0A9J7LYN2_BRAFL|nr:uncharacterized protein LOC118425812 [Branchiostoma floridae]
MFSPIRTLVLAVFIVELEGARDCMDVWYNGYHEGGVFYLGQTRGRAYCEVREFSVAVESSGSGDPGFDASTSTFITVGQNTTNFAGNVMYVIYFESSSELLSTLTVGTV